MHHKGPHPNGLMSQVVILWICQKFTLNFLKIKWLYIWIEASDVLTLCARVVVLSNPIWSDAKESVMIHLPKPLIENYNDFTISARHTNIIWKKKYFKFSWNKRFSFDVSRRALASSGLFQFNLLIYKIMLLVYILNCNCRTHKACISTCTSIIIMSNSNQYQHTCIS